MQLEPNPLGMIHIRDPVIIVKLPAGKSQLDLEEGNTGKLHGKLSVERVNCGSISAVVVLGACLSFWWLCLWDHSGLGG